MEIHQNRANIYLASNLWDCQNHLLVFKVSVAVMLVHKFDRLVNVDKRITGRHMLINHFPVDATRLGVLEKRCQCSTHF